MEKILVLFIGWTLFSGFSSISEDRGVALLSENDCLVYSVGISTGCEAEMRMANLLPERKIVATTIDPVGAEFAREKIGPGRQIEVKIENVSGPLPYEEGTFDFVYARLVLHYLPRQELGGALRELHRILKEGGKMFVVVRSASCPEAVSQQAIYDPETGLTTCFAREGGTYARFFHTEASIQEFIREAGFAIGSVESYQERLCIDFQRTQLSDYVDELIEIVAVKNSGI